MQDPKEKNAVFEKFEKSQSVKPKDYLIDKEELKNDINVTLNSKFIVENNDGTENFEPMYSEPSVDEELQLQQNFRDFKESPKISGRNTDVPLSRIIPSEYLIAKGESIALHLDREEDGDGYSQVITHKNSAGNIEMLEVICKCGESTFIRLKEEEMDSSEYSLRAQLYELKGDDSNALNEVLDKANIKSSSNSEIMTGQSQIDNLSSLTDQDFDENDMEDNI